MTEAGSSPQATRIEAKVWRSLCGVRPVVRDPPASWEHAIARAVRDAARDGGGCLQVISILRALQAPAGREVADALEVVADLGLARLGFADVTEGASLEAGLGRAVTTVRAPGLTLPEPGVARETYTRAERVSVATLSLVAALALRLVSAERVRHKVVILDEDAVLARDILLVPPAGEHHLIDVAEEAIVQVLEEVQLASVLGVVADPLVDAIHPHVACRTHAEVPIDALGLPVVVVSVRPPALAVIRRIRLESAGVLIPCCSWPPYAAWSSLRLSSVPISNIAHSDDALSMTRWTIPTVPASMPSRSSACMGISPSGQVRAVPVCPVVHTTDTLRMSAWPSRCWRSTPSTP